jgi:hypothetical protein
MSGLVPLGNAATSVSSRFNLVSLAPSALLATAIGAMVASGAFTGVPSLHLLLVRSGEVNVFIASVIFLLVFSASLVLHPFQLLLVRILEGYWTDVPILRKLRFIGIEINRRRYWEIRVLEDDAQDRLLSLYPPKTEDLLPTRLGNVLRSAERQAGGQHGFTNAVEMLPRIYPYMSASLTENMADARDDLDMACRMCAVLWTIALVAGCTLAADGAVAASAGAWLAAPVVAAAFGVLSYRAAVRCAGKYGQLLYLVFDLHRRDFIRALGYVPPEDPADEKKLIEDLTNWLTGAGSPPVDYREKLPSDSAAGQLRCRRIRSWPRLRPRCWFPHRRAPRHAPGARGP